MYWLKLVMFSLCQRLHTWENFRLMPQHHRRFSFSSSYRNSVSGVGWAGVGLARTFRIKIYYTQWGFEKVLIMWLHFWKGWLGLAKKEKKTQKLIANIIAYVSLIVASRQVLLMWWGGNGNRKFSNFHKTLHSQNFKIPKSYFFEENFRPWSGLK